MVSGIYSSIVFYSFCRLSYGVFILGGYIRYKIGRVTIIYIVEVNFINIRWRKNEV